MCITLITADLKAHTKMPCCYTINTVLHDEEARGRIPLLTGIDPISYTIYVQFVFEDLEDSRDESVMTRAGAGED